MVTQPPLVKSKPITKLNLARPCPNKAPLPTMYDLPSETPGEPGLPDTYHFSQGQLLRETCQSPVYAADQMWTAVDVNLYYEPNHTLWYKRPDWYMVLGVSATDALGNLRLSYVVWQEEIAPYLVIELLSPGTEKDDLGTRVRDEDKPPTKWQVYEQILQIPYYIVYDYRGTEPILKVFTHEGQQYQLLDLPDQRWWSEELQLGLGIWRGEYEHEGVVVPWLRWHRADGTLVPTHLERIRRERQQTEQQRQRAQQAEQDLQQLTAKLRALGIDTEAQQRFDKE